MKRKNMTRNALFTSILSLLLCVSMLVGTTFAWFTDEVQSGMNTIAAGNLDVELLADGQKVNADTKLFDDVSLWEPGVVLYENLQVANVGTLALKYQMTINFGKENNLNGHKLSEVLQVAVIDKVAEGATRADVLAAAKAKIAADGKDASLANFVLNGGLEAGASTTEQSFVIFWEPNDNATDNLYNANNGQITSDGEPLHIEFGINLQATQLMYEEDSFGNDYDDFASILPKATVNNVSETYPTITATAGIGGAADTMPLDFALQFLPNETLDEAMTSDYKYYNVDFVIKADKAVPANSMALAGFYSAWCDGINNGNWVALASSEDIAANTEIRLVETMGNGSIKVSYKDICEYAVRPENTINGFLCGATDLTGANAGTTITVELRAYETTSDPTNSSNTGTEVGPDAYEVIGVYSYTFPNVAVTSDEELAAALASGANGIEVAAGTYTFPKNNLLTKDTTLYCEPGTVFEGNSKLNINGATVVGATFSNPTGTAVDQTINGTFKDCTFDGSNGLRWCYAGETVVFENCVFEGDTYGVHFDGGANEVVFKNCTLSGFNAMGGAITKLTMEGCTFQPGRSGYNGINLWGTTEMIDCTFVFDGIKTEWIDMCGDNTTGTFTGCVISDGTTERALTAADVGDYGTGNTITVN